MKRIVAIGVIVLALQACGGSGEGGTINDGFKGGADTNGALNNNANGPLTDSTGNAVENKTRTDIQQRDTFTTKGQ
jgi:hypothetical protein